MFSNDNNYCTKDKDHAFNDINSNLQVLYDDNPTITHFQPSITLTEFYNCTNATLTFYSDHII